MSIHPGVFFGTPDFAAVCLRQLIAHNLTPRLVVTQPDRPAGRNRKLTASAVKQLALQHKIEVCQPESLKGDIPEHLMAELQQSDCAVVVAYGALLPAKLLNAPKHGCLNIHASLLPRWRGASPVQHAILAGDSTTGISIIQMDEGLDSGAVLYKKSCRIGTDETASELHDKLADLGSECIVHCLQNHASLTLEKQDNEKANYAGKITKDMANIDWTEDARVIARMVRGYNSWPVAYTHLEPDKTSPLRVRVWKAFAVDESENMPPGTLFSTKDYPLAVCCGRGALILQQMQLPGTQVMSIQDILNSRSNQFCPEAQFIKK